LRGAPELPLGLPPEGRLAVARWLYPPESWLDEELLGRVEPARSEEHTSELQSLTNLVCRLLLQKKKHHTSSHTTHSLSLHPTVRAPDPRRPCCGARPPSLFLSYTPHPSPPPPFPPRRSSDLAARRAGTAAGAAPGGPPRGRALALPAGVVAGRGIARAGRAS